MTFWKEKHTTLLQDMKRHLLRSLSGLTSGSKLVAKIKVFLKVFMRKCLSCTLTTQRFSKLENLITFTHCSYADLIVFHYISDDFFYWS